MWLQIAPVEGLPRSIDTATVLNDMTTQENGWNRASLRRIARTGVNVGEETRAVALRQKMKEIACTAEFARQDNSNEGFRVLETAKMKILERM